MELRDGIRSTGAVRQFQATPVSDEVVFAILDDARFAPSGGNRQGWRVVVVKGRAQRLRLGAAMRPVVDRYGALRSTGLTPFAMYGEDGSDLVDLEHAPSLPNDLVDNIAEVPVVLLIGLDMRCVSLMDGALDRPAVTSGASIYPFVWNILLAARSRGLGGVITTFASRAEPEIAADLGLPPEVALAATIFLGQPVHQPTKLRRNDVASFTTIDRFDGPIFGSE